MFTHTITRLPGPDFAQGLTTSKLGKPSFPLILQQHQAYVNTLRSLGLEVTVLEAEPGYPDAYFVEDPAIMTPHQAILTRPGAPSRLGEGISLEPVLAQFRPLVHIQPPGTLEGGDVLLVGSRFFIGLSERTNADGAKQLADIVAADGFPAEMVPVGAGLHLKSSVSYVGKGTLLVTQALADYPGFKAYRQILVDPDEEYAANTLWVNDHLLTPKGFPKTLRKLANLGLEIIEMEVSEVQKMDGGLTCMSLRF
jgi:dimethylargininase